MHQVEKVLPGIKLDHWRGSTGVEVPLRPADRLPFDSGGKPASCSAATTSRSVRSVRFPR